MFLLPTVTYAISAQWNLNPVSGDWNTAANWTPTTIQAARDRWIFLHELSRCVFIGRLKNGNAKCLVAWF